jgi:hypothetical protein
VEAVWLNFAVDQAEVDNDGLRTFRTGSFGHSPT